MGAHEGGYAAKDIQLIVGITRQRYEYIKNKANIQPGVEEVEGTGRSHTWDFKNLMEFALADRVSSLGLPPRSVAEIVEYVNEYDKKYNTGFFEKDAPPQPVSIYHLILFRLWGDRGPYDLRAIKIESDKGSEYYTKGLQRKSDKNDEGIKKYFKIMKKIPMGKAFSQALDVGVEGYTKTNLYSIKVNILKAHKSTYYKFFKNQVKNTHPDILALLRENLPEAYRNLF